MTQKLPLCFEVYLKGDAPNLLRLNSSISAYEMLLSSLVQVCEQFTFSLRHLYDPSGNQKLRSFVLINPSSQSYSHEILQKIEGLLTGSLSRFYSFTHQPEVFKQLNWVSSIGEIFKHGEFVEQPEFIGYLPYLFSTELIDDGFSILESLEAARCEKLVLEFSLETYDSPSEQACWKNAIEDLVSRLSSCASKSNSVKYALELYRNYQSNYTENQLFKYSLKALSCNAIDTVAILQTFLGLLGKVNARQKIGSILTYSPNDSSFKGSLEATQNIQVFQNIKWHGWEKSIGTSLEKKFIKETVKSGGSSDDGSLAFPILPSNLGQLNSSQKINHTLSASNESTLAPNSSDLVLGENTSLPRIFEVQIPKVEHLKPLHHITTLQEVVGFFQVFSPCQTVIPPDPDTMLTIGGIINKFGDLITEDTYVAGIDQKGNPCISDFRILAHRLVGGMTGTGKTNYILSVVYQFLHANPEREVYMIDFQAGLHYEFTIKKRKSVTMVTTFEECDQLLKSMLDKHSQRRQEMIKYQCRDQVELCEKKSIKQNRILLIIDEAFYIKNSDRDYKKSIETNLNTLAAQARATGIHIFYCTQTPTSEVLDSQTRNNIGERVLFAVESASDSRLIIGTDKAYELPLIPKGRAMYKGSDRLPIQIATPFVPDEVW
jgi:hypothetical protein